VTRIRMPTRIAAPTCPSRRRGRARRRSWPRPDDAIQHFLPTAERYGYSNATPEANAAVGFAI
jgi:hypothetical protein